MADARLEAVAFHTGVADPVAHLRRLIAKTSKLGEPLTVLCSVGDLDAFDAALWATDREDFVPHARFDSTPAVRSRSLIELVVDPAQTAGRARCVNLTGQWVEALIEFKRVVEVVTPQGTAAARERWKRYAALGASLSNTAF